MRYAISVALNWEDVQVSTIAGSYLDGVTFLIDLQTSDLSRKGNQPLFVVDTSSMTGGNTGTQPSATVVVSRAASNDFMFDALPGDAIFAYANQPQVVVTVNNVPSFCASNCAYVVSDAVAYQFTSYSVTSTGLTINLVTPAGATNTADDF